MDLGASPTRPPKESIVPMINVVFLLLIFFLMTSQLAPPAPVEIVTPHSTLASDPEARTRVYLDSAGTLYFEDLTDEAALAALSHGPDHAEHLLLSADKGVEAVKLAALLRKLTQLGVPRVELLVAPE